MSERGVFAVDRGLFGHPRFADEPFTEREAWIWMIGQAAFRPYCRRIGAFRVELARGAFAHSLRFMAERWRWSPSRVKRFLALLAADTNDDKAMIDTRNETGITVVSIRNYDAYQPIAFDLETPNETAPAQQRHKEESIEQKDRGGGGGEGEPSTGKLFQSEDHELATAFLSAINADTDGPLYSSVAYSAALWRQRGYDRALILATAAEIATKGEQFPLSYYFKAVVRVHEERAQQPPASSISSTERPHAEATPHRAGGDWRARRDEQHAARAELRAFVAAHTEPPPDRGDESNGPVVCLVPHA